jgi:hypothetical protein
MSMIASLILTLMFFWQVSVSELVMVVVGEATEHAIEQGRLFIAATDILWALRQLGNPLLSLRFILPPHRSFSAFLCCRLCYRLQLVGRRLWAHADMLRVQTYEHMSRSRGVHGITRDDAGKVEGKKGSASHTHISRPKCSVQSPNRGIAI